MNEPNAAQPSAEAQAGTSAFTQIFSGLGLGLLIGIIAGLSVSPVVQTILGTLVTILAAFLSVQGGSEGAEGSLFRRLKMNELRVGSFAFACVAGIMLGLFIRSHELLSSTVEDQVQKWTDAGYSKTQALQFVAYQKLAVKPTDVEIAENEITKASAASLSSNLYKELAEIDFCREISLERFGDDVPQVLKAYRRQDNDKLNKLADQVERLPDSKQQKEMLKAMEEVLCDLLTQNSSQ